MKWGAYFRLARFHKPVGILLLWAPTAWALWLANQGHPSIQLVVIVLFGTIIMRAAGCIVNDIADRQIDLHVARTKTRPLTSGEITLVEAVGVLGFFLFCALLLLIQLPVQCTPYALAALLVTGIYPLCKRIISAPQLILGVAFSMGIPMVYVASGVAFNQTFWSLCVINFLWIIAYDTQYAMVDRADDLLIGVKSTAILFGQWDRVIINVLLAMMHLGWLFVAISLGFKYYFFIVWGIGLALLIAEDHLIANRDPKRCFQAFMLNCWYGIVMWGGLLHW